MKNLLYIPLLFIMLIGCTTNNVSNDNIETVDTHEEKDNDVQEIEFHEEERNKNEDLNKIVDLIKQEKYSTALMLASNYQGDEDFETLSAFAHSLLEKRSGHLEKSNDYLITISDNYDGLMSEEIKSEKQTVNKIVAEDIKKAEQNRKRIEEDLIRLIKEGNLEEAMDYYQNTPNILEVEDQNIYYLYSYLSLMETLKSGSEYMFFSMLIELPVEEMTDIDEDIALELQNLKITYEEEIKDHIANKKKHEKERDARQAEKEREEKEYLSKDEPSIGMTADEVIESRWGKPKKINKTINKYGVSEQWVYDGYKYIYLDDGIVTTIQE